jgi:hypothetical protein
MAYGPSAFYVKFSLADLPRKSCYYSEGTASAGGGSGGGRSSSCGPSKYHRSEVFTLHLGSAREFDEAEFISSFKDAVQSEIVTCGLSIDALNHVGGSEFEIAYGEKDLKGSIKVVGTPRANFYSLHATLSETSSSKTRPLMNLQNLRPQPVGDYHVVPFFSDEQAQRFYELGQRAISESNTGIMRSLATDSSKNAHIVQNLEYAEVYIWKKLTPELNEILQKATGQEFGIPAEYDQYPVVVFLNGVALKMYSDLGEDVEVLKTIPADDLRNVPGPSLRGPYRRKE